MPAFGTRIGLGARRTGVGAPNYIADLFADGTLGRAYDFSVASRLFTTSGGSTNVAANDDPIGRAVSSDPNAGTATQGTSSARPWWETTYGKFDGVDDCLVDTLVPAASTLLAVCGQGTTGQFLNSTTASDTNYASLQIMGTGKLGGSCGSQTGTTITGGSSISGVDFVGLIRMTQGGTVELWLNGVRIYNSAQAGTINTTRPFQIGRYLGSSAAGYLSGRIYRAVMAQRFTVPHGDDIPNLMRQIGAGIVSF